MGRRQEAGGWRQEARGRVRLRGGWSWWGGWRLPFSGDHLVPPLAASRPSQPPNLSLATRRSRYRTVARLVAVRLPVEDEYTGGSHKEAPAINFIFTFHYTCLHLHTVHELDVILRTNICITKFRYCHLLIKKRTISLRRLWRKLQVLSLGPRLFTLHQKVTRIFFPPLYSR